jgi:hypothetical protein
MLKQLEARQKQQETQLKQYRRTMAIHQTQIARVCGRTLINMSRWTFLKIGVRELRISLNHMPGISVAKCAVRKIPVVGLFISIRSAMDAIKRGRKGKGAAMIASGTLACVPGLGTLFSFVIDAGMAIDEYGSREVVRLYEPAIYSNLDLDLGEDPELSQATVDEAHEEATMGAQSDNPDPETLSDRISVLDASKDYIYEKKGWQVLQ